MAERLRFSIGVKLTFRYAVAVAVTITAVATFVYSQVAARVNREASLLLELQAQELAEEYVAELARDPKSAAVARLSERFGRWIERADASLDLGIELVDADGARLVGLGSLAGSAPPVAQDLLDGRSERLLRALNLGVERPYLSMAVAVPDGAIRIVMSTERYAENVRAIRDVFLWSLPVVLLLTAGIGWLLARGSLRPIAQMTDTAQRIDADRADERVPVSGSGDELDRLATTLNGMIGRLGQSLSRMRRFNADAAHQLRTPLNAISNQLEVTLARERGEDEYRSVLADALERARQMSAGVDAMLRLAQIEVGLPADERRPIAIAEVLETVREFFGPVAEESGVELVAATGGDAYVAGDSSWLHELFSNLVSNALRYTPEGGRIRLETERQDGRVIVRVRDTGPGIDAERLPHIFERFDRGGEAVQPGFGLGLAIASEIARAHDGELSAASELGKGACFSVAIPTVERGGAA